jgi:hypothetical protein
LSQGECRRIYFGFSLIIRIPQYFLNASISLLLAVAGEFFLNKAQGSVMSLEKEIVPKGDYHSSLEVIVENSYATSAGKLVVYLEGGHFNRQFGADEFALNTLSDAVAFGKTYQ